jgi:hypothetical protein
MRRDEKVRPATTKGSISGNPEPALIARFL